VRGLLDRAGQPGEERVGEALDDQADHVGAPHPQRPGHQVRLEPEVGDGLLHPGPGARRDVRVAVDHPGDRLGAHLGDARDVTQRHAVRHREPREERARHAPPRIGVGLSGVTPVMQQPRVIDVKRSLHGRDTAERGR
jgi:hypothetical protein